MAYVWNAEDYKENSKFQMKWGEELIGKLNLQSKDSVIDIGCGDGKISAMISKIAVSGKTLGIDSSENMVKLASVSFPNEQYQNLTFAKMDAAEIKLNEKFDAAFSNACLHWVKDHDMVLKGVRSCLKKNGKILFQMGGSGNAQDVTDSFSEVMKKNEWKNYFNGFMTPYCFYGMEHYEKWLPENDFKTVRIELIPKDMVYSNKDAFKGWLRTTWFPYTDPLPETLREDFLSDIVKTYKINNNAGKLENILVKMIRLEVEAYAK